MTTVAVNKTSMACDRQFSHSGGVKFRGATKVTTLSPEVADALFGVKAGYVGFCGNADIWGRCVAWLAAPEGKPPKCKEIEFLLLTDQKKIYHSDNLIDWMEIQEKHFAIGSGMQYAIAAMDQGASPKEAIVCAAKYDRATGKGIKEYTF